MHVAVAAHVRTTVDGDGAVLLDLERGVYLSLNRSGAAIWSELTAGAAPADVAARIAARCSKPVAEVERDVRSFVDELARRGLVRVSG
jgi:hypothetical protein